MPFPFLFLAIALASGILFSSVLSLSLFALILVLLLFLNLAWLAHLLRKDKYSFMFILLATFIYGAALYSHSNRSFEENSLHKLKSSVYADFYGTLYKSPSRGNDNYFLFLKVEKVLCQNKVEKIGGNLRITVPRSSEFPSPLDLFVHDKIKVSARLAASEGFRNFKTFSLETRLKSLKIHQRAFAKSPLLVERLEAGKKYSFLRWISILRRKLQQKIEEYFPSSAPEMLSPPGAVLEALLLGERARMAPPVTQSLQQAGIYHLFAISGAHIAIISFLLFSLLKLLRVPSRPSYLLLMGFLLFYAFLVEGRPSVMRATIMTLTFLLGKLIWKKVNLINTISLAAFTLLIFNPFNLFDSGFQLTFAATLSIILFFPRIIKYLPKLPLRISDILVLSLTAQLGVLPFMASSFNRVTFSSLILNFGAVPLVGLIMVCGYFFLPFSFVSPFLGHLLANAIKFLIGLLITFSHLFDRFSLISYRIPTPHLFTVIGYFLFLYLLVLPPRIKGQKLISFLLFLAFFTVLIAYPFPSSSKNLKLTFIDVSQGDSILVEFPGHKKMLIDGGGLPEGNFDIGENVVSPFLWKKGIKKIDYLVLTHAHPDHLFGLKAIAKNFKIGEYWEAFSPAESEEYSEFKRLLPRSATSKRMFRGDSRQEGKVRIDILHPERGEYIVPAVHNDQSLVLRLQYNQTSFLLTGDIGKEAEFHILENFEEIKSQVLKSPHHGSRSSSSENFLTRVAPGIVVISVGQGNRYGFPDQETIEKYQEIGAKVYRTDLHGAVEVSSDGESIFVRTASERNWKHP